MPYAISTLWGYATAADEQHLEAVIWRAVCAVLYPADGPNLHQLVSDGVDALFAWILANEHHILWQLLPNTTTHSCGLCHERHNYALNIKSETCCWKNTATICCILTTLFIKQIWWWWFGRMAPAVIGFVLMKLHFSQCFTKLCKHCICYCKSVPPSVQLSVRHTSVLCQKEGCRGSQFYHRIAQCL